MTRYRILTKCLRTTLCCFTMALLAGCPSSAKKANKSQGPPSPNAPNQAMPSISLSHTPSGNQVYKPTPGEPAPLASFFKSLHKLRKKSPTKQTVSIIHVGDSHVASDTMTGETRRRFQTAWGNAGRGYVYPGRPWRNFRQDGVKYAMGGKWDVHNGKSPRATGTFSFGGIRIVSTEKGDWFERESRRKPFNEAHVHFLKSAKSGSFNIYINDEDKPIDTVSTALDANKTDPNVVYEVGVHPLVFTKPVIKIKIEAVDEDPITIVGVDTQRKTSGILYHSLGLNGARAKTMLKFDHDLSVQELGYLKPDLFVIGFGTNEAYNLRKTTMEPKHSKRHVASLRALIKRYKQGAPQAACLVLLPVEFALKPRAKTCYKRKRIKRKRRWRWVNKLIDDIDLEENPECTWTVPPSLDVIRQATIKAANLEHCAIWDQYAAMGGQGSMRTWAKHDPPLSGSDGVHLRLRGYQMLGQMLYLDIMRAYEQWEKTKDATLLTTPWEPPAQKAAP